MDRRKALKTMGVFLVTPVIFEVITIKKEENWSPLMDELKKHPMDKNTKPKFANKFDPPLINVKELKHRDVYVIGKGHNCGYSFPFQFLFFVEDKTKNNLHTETIRCLDFKNNKEITAAFISPKNRNYKVRLIGRLYNG